MLGQISWKSNKKFYSDIFETKIIKSSIKSLYSILVNQLKKLCIRIHTCFLLCLSHFDIVSSNLRIKTINWDRVPTALSVTLRLEYGFVQNAAHLRLRSEHGSSTASHRVRFASGLIV